MDPICLVLGTRPEIIKMSPIISRLKEREIAYYIIHTNQHYSTELDSIFFQQLELPPPDFSLDVGSGTHGEQTGKMLQRIEQIFLKSSTSFVLVQGDTNTTLAGALSASKLNIPVGHIEAGLRSHDRKMPEEINRIMTDHIADICFVPTKNQKKILLNEGIDQSKILITGNTVVDAVFRNRSLMKEEILQTFNLQKKKYFLLTIHRQENVDDPVILQEIFDSIAEAGNIHNYDIIAPLHPRTLSKIKKAKIEVRKGISIIKPVGYFEFLALQKNAALIITDSGGLQEESCILKTPCVTVRENTERPETVEVGANIIGGVRRQTILPSIEVMLQKKPNWQNPFGDGHASEKIINYIVSKIKQG
ncbi:MAG: non-hydrolyzing UDP-N-acetylglucosamine 2-epimerase [Candidatus Hodarchaeota archaeon]